MPFDSLRKIFVQFEICTNLHFIISNTVHSTIPGKTCHTSHSFSVHGRFHRYSRFKFYSVVKFQFVLKSLITYNALTIVSGAGTGEMPEMNKKSLQPIFVTTKISEYSENYL